MALNPDQYRLSDAQHQAIFEQDITPDLFAGAKKSNHPVAVIFGGQPGAGKSAAVDSAIRELGPRGGAIQIIGDDLRAYHPHYARLMERDDKTAAFYTDRDTGQWVEKAIAEAKARQVNLVIEGTMRDGNKVAATMENLRAAGYEIDARALAVNPRLSEQGILQRYESQKADRGTGRMTTPEAHQAAYAGMPATLERIERDKLADRLTIYRRGAEAIYSNELQGGQWMREPQARAVVEAERARPMTLPERRDYAQSFDRLAEQLARPERQASAEETRKLADLRRQAQAGLAAEVFRQETPENAVQQFPELAPAYAFMRVREAKAEAVGLSQQQRAIVMARVRDNVAEQIERGDVPSVQIREERQVKAEQQRGIER
jgi:predicted ABC-type ATPase